MILSIQQLWDLNTSIKSTGTSPADLIFNLSFSPFNSAKSWVSWGSRCEGPGPHSCHGSPTHPQHRSPLPARGRGERSSPGRVWGGAAAPARLSQARGRRGGARRGGGARPRAPAGAPGAAQRSVPLSAAAAGTEGSRGAEPAGTELLPPLPPRPGPRYLLAGRVLQQLRADIRALPELPPPEVAPGLEQRLQPHLVGGRTAGAPAGPAAPPALSPNGTRGGAGAAVPVLPPGPASAGWGGALGRGGGGSGRPPGPAARPGRLPWASGHWAVATLSAGPLPASASRRLITLGTESSVWSAVLGWADFQ